VCPVCDGDAFETTAMAGVTMHRCRTCGLRTSEIVRSARVNYGDVSERAYLESIGRVRRAQARTIVSLAHEHRSGGEWLDVGCGYGFVLDAASERGFEVRGLEPDSVAATAARSRIPTVQQGLLTEETPAADIISTLDVIEHLDDVNAFARLVRRKTRDLWVIKVPSADGIFFRVAHAFRLSAAVARLWQRDYAHPHTLYFVERSLRRLVGKHAFEVVAVRYLQEVPLNTVVDRMTLDGSIPRWRARLAVPLFAVINAVERMRSRSDALLMIARKSD
jgi:2-polyprenyl-3-methyl-5-hydroxy-6-metoxy-1,4-benzoquinol methylase